MSLVIVVSVAVGLILVVVCLAWQQRIQSRWPSDAELLARMRNEGIDLSKTYVIEFHLHFASRTVALEAERALIAEGYAAQVSAGEGLPNAIVCAKKPLVPNKPQLRAVRAQLVAIAQRYGGSYEGWFPPSDVGGGAA